MNKVNTIIEIESNLRDKYNIIVGTDLIQHEKEFIDLLNNAGIITINNAEYYELEFSNYHTILKILTKNKIYKSDINE